jgi:tetratricopeptide (TPR) repeat protein
MSSTLSTKVLCFAIVFAGFTSQEASLIKELDHSYSLAKSTDDFYRIEVLFKKSLKKFSRSDKLHWRLGRVYFKLGEKSNTGSEKINYFSLCMAQTKKAIEINSGSANGYFFNGLCNGTLGEAQGIWSSLGIIDPFKKDMETTISLDPSVEEGGPHRALGNLYLEIPYFLGGNLELSIKHFQKAIQLGPEFGENYLGLAEVYIENEDFVLAKDVLDQFLDMELSSQNNESILEWRAEALNLLKKIQDQ